ncbi:DUF2577 domain-containing protein [Bacillus horti]|uniref:DUF2577 domain-containing protein n=1 Tax=Caldalkalibacillus horti TaxID=77523 RepID=A0ABT9W069_9BACI|nr:DUF2577 domain-containing protein [Bacillus horti]MDQ0166642.1 hypothetical protein [Bacillus horti]
MANLLEMIKQAGLDAMEASNPLHILYGKVLKNNPLEVNVDQRFTLSSDFLIVPEHLTRYEVDLTHQHEVIVDGVNVTTRNALPEKLVIREGLSEGDPIILLRVQGGQKYLIMDKVASG